jgi:hypothetical protein
MFDLNKQGVTLASLTTKTNNHGTDKVPAVSMRLSMDASNAYLKMFSPFLGDALYAAKDGKTELTELKLPQIEVFDWALVLSEVRITILSDLNASEALFILPDCKVDKFKIAPKQGGTVNISFNVSCEPDAECQSHLYVQQNHGLLINLEPKNEQQELEGFD